MEDDFLVPEKIVFHEQERENNERRSEVRTMSKKDENDEQKTMQERKRREKRTMSKREK